MKDSSLYGYTLALMPNIKLGAALTMIGHDHEPVLSCLAAKKV